MVCSGIPSNKVLLEILQDHNIGMLSLTCEVIAKSIASVYSPSVL